MPPTWRQRPAWSAEVLLYGGWRKGWPRGFSYTPEPSKPKAIVLRAGRLAHDGQRHIRCGPGAGDDAVHLAVFVELPAILDLEVQPQPPAFGPLLAAVRLAGQVHPIATAVLRPIAVDPQCGVQVQTEALAAAAGRQSHIEAQQSDGCLQPRGQPGRCVLLLLADDARAAVGADLAVLAADHQGHGGGRRVRRVACSAGADHNGGR